MPPPHNFLFQRPSRDKSVNVDDFLLPDAMGTIHSLQVSHWIPIMLHEYDLKLMKMNF